MTNASYVATPRRLTRVDGPYDLEDGFFFCVTFRFEGDTEDTEDVPGRRMGYSADRFGYDQDCLEGMVSKLKDVLVQEYLETGKLVSVADIHTIACTIAKEARNA